MKSRSQGTHKISDTKVIEAQIDRTWVLVKVLALDQIPFRILGLDEQPPDMTEHQAAGRAVSIESQAII